MQTSTSADRLIDIRKVSSSGWKKACVKAVAPLLENLLSIGKFNRAYVEFSSTWQGGDFFSGALEYLDIRYRVSEEHLSRIPRKGSLLVLANHPFGGVDGLVLGSLLKKVRPDFKGLTNYLLGAFPQLRPWIIPVDPFGGADTVARNARNLKEAIRWLRQDNALFTFPSGTVSHLTPGGMKIADPAWSPSTGALIRHSNATVLPVFFTGSNSLLFQLAGLIHPAIRTALLPRELMGKTGSEIEVRIGTPINNERMLSFASNQELVKFLRLKTEVLRDCQPENEKKRFWPSFMPFRKKTGQTPICPPIDPELIQADVRSLPLDQLLVAEKQYRVYLARAAQIPHLLQEMGRLREDTFRRVGEGTGKATDLDAYDKHYQHLFLWNEEKSEVVGAYRIGLVDQILNQQGIKGLYTSSLFRYKSAFFDKLDPAVELGRSFIRHEYQKMYSSLSLLWRGIGAFVVRNPRYRILFGPVSISREYHTLSRNLMVYYLKRHKWDQRYEKLVKPKNPPRSRLFPAKDFRVLDASLSTLEDLSAFIADIEADAKKIPVLLKQYLRLNGALLSFNVDDDFSRVIDGLILVDLDQTEKRILKRYLGKQGYDRFKAYKKQAACQSAQVQLPRAS